MNRLCGSGFQAIVNGAQDIILGAARIALTGGVDNMSLSPFIVRNVRFGTALGVNYAFEDSLWVCSNAKQFIALINQFEYFIIFFLIFKQQSVSDTYCKSPMAITAENLAEKYKIARDVVDQFSLRSQQLWQTANEAGVFKTEITPYKLSVKGKDIEFAVDEHPK